MRVSATILGFLAATSLALSPAFAQGHGAKPAKSPSSVKPKTIGQPVATTTRSIGKPTTSGRPVATTTRSIGKPTTSGKPVATMARSTGKPATSGKPVATTTRSTGKPTTSGRPVATTTRSTGKPSTIGNQASGSTATLLNPIAAKIASKPNLSAKLTGMLPIDPLTGRTMTLDKASLGFKNQGQFIAALHVSQNLRIPFSELKSHMVTVTPGAPGQLPTATQTGSLGQAIQASKTTTSVTTEVGRAETQASADLLSASSTPSSITSGSTLQKNKTTKKTTTGRGR